MGWGTGRGLEGRGLGGAGAGGAARLQGSQRRGAGRRSRRLQREGPGKAGGGTGRDYAAGDRLRGEVTRDGPWPR